MTWTVNYNGSSIDFDRASLSIKQEANRLDTASFTVTKDVAQIMQRWAELTIDFDGQLIFGGYVQTVPRQSESANVRQYRVTARSYAVRLYQSRRIRKAWTETALQTIISDILVEGGFSGEFTSISVDDNPTLTIYINAQNVGAAFDYLRSYLTGTQDTLWLWRIDQNKTVQFLKYTTRTNTWAIATSEQDAQDAGWSGPVKRPKPDSFMVEDDDTQIVNSVRIFGGEKASDDVTDTFTGNGSQTKFHVSNYPIADLISVKVNGSAVNAGVDYFDADCPSYDVYVNFNAGYVRFCTAPASGATIEVTYRYFETLTYSEEDSVSIAQYGMRFYKDVEDKSIVNDEDAQVLAGDILARFAYGELKGSAKIEITAASDAPIIGSRLFVVWPDEGVQDYYNLTGAIWQAEDQQTAVITVSFGGQGVKLNDVMVARSAQENSAYQRQTAPKVYGQMGSVALIEELRVGDAYGFLQGVGKWVGRDADGIYKEFTGNPSSGQYWSWDGATLHVSGLITGSTDLDGTQADDWLINSDRDAAGSSLTFGGSGGDAKIEWDGVHLSFNKITQFLTSTEMHGPVSIKDTLAFDGGDILGNLLPDMPGIFDIGSSIHRWNQAFLSLLDVSGNASIGGNLLPSVTDTSDIGSISYRWRNLYAGAGDFSGAVDIDQDLTVGGGTGVLFVDVSGQRVGINTVPDAQFDLDVAGNMRAQGWIVGKHAIQLSDAEMICHFDGPQPYETNFIGETTGHRGQVANVSGGVIFRPGRFGKAVQVAEASTNFVKNPSFETGDMTAWSFSYNTSGGNAAVNIDDSQYGEHSLKIETGGAGYCYAVTSVIAVSPDTDYTASAFMKQVAGSGYGRLLVWLYDSSNNFLQDVGVNFTDGQHDWERKSVSFTTPSNATQAKVVLEQGDHTDDAVCYWDAVQLEQKPYVTSYLDGSLGDGHSWSGTPHASTSSRIAAVISYDNPIKRDAGTISLWWRPVASSTDAPTSYLFDDGSLSMWFDSTDSKIHVSDGTNEISSAVTFSADDDVFLACTFDDNLSLWINPSSDTPSATGAYIAPATTMTLYVGSDTSGASQADGLIDDFVVVSRELDADEIRAIYESNAPVFAETSTWQFRATPKGLVWADEEGLWMRTESGDAVLGVYGGEAGGKSWGGQTLDTGDLLIGRGSQYVLWDDSAGQLTVVGSINILDGSGVANLSDSGALATQDTADWYSDITNRPVRFDDAPSGSGLYLAADHLGFYDGSAWKTYMDNSGNFYLTGSGGNYLEWNAATSTLTAAGWKLDIDAIVKDTGVDNESAGMAPSDYPFYAGATYANRASAPFRVTPSGALFANNANVSGTVTATSGKVGDFDIISGVLQSGNLKLDAPNERIYLNAGVYFAAYGGGIVLSGGDLVLEKDLVQTGTTGQSATLFNLDVFGTTEIYGDLDMHGFDIYGVDDITLNDFLHVGGNTQIDGELTVSNRATFNSEIFAYQIWGFGSGNSISFDVVEATGVFQADGAIGDTGTIDLTTVTEIYVNKGIVTGWS